MPHARMLHELLDDNLVENKLKTTILDYYHQCFSDMPDRIHLYGRAASRDRQLFQVQVHDYRCEIRDHFSKPGSDPNITTKIIRRQAKLDPSSLICDAVLCTSISVDKELPSNIQEKAHEFLRQSQFIVGNRSVSDQKLEPTPCFLPRRHRKQGRTMHCYHLWFSSTRIGREQRNRHETKPSCVVCLPSPSWHRLGLRVSRCMD